MVRPQGLCELDHLASGSEHSRPERIRCPTSSDVTRIAHDAAASRVDGGPGIDIPRLRRNYGARVCCR